VSKHVTKNLQIDSHRRTEHATGSKTLTVERERGKDSGSRAAVESHGRSFLWDALRKLHNRQWYDLKLRWMRFSGGQSIHSENGPIHGISSVILLAKVVRSRHKQ
jgi:hypothetical protein